MKKFILSVVEGLFLLVCFNSQALAQNATASASPSPSASASGKVKGLYDDSLTSEFSDASASATLSATPKPRATTYSTATTPVSGATENTILLLIGGSALFILGFRFSKA